MDRKEKVIGILLNDYVELAYPSLPVISVIKYRYTDTESGYIWTSRLWIGYGKAPQQPKVGTWPPSRPSWHLHPLGRLWKVHKVTTYFGALHRTNFTALGWSMIRLILSWRKAVKAQRQPATDVPPYGGRRLSSSVARWMFPRLWDVKNNRASGKSAEAQRINRAVDKIQVEINRRYQELMQTDGYVTAAKLERCLSRYRYQTGNLAKTVWTTQQRICKESGTQQGQRNIPTLHNRLQASGVPAPYLQAWRYSPKELNLTFINDFEYFLRTEKKCRTNTIWGYDCVETHYFHSEEWRSSAVQSLCRVHQLSRKRGQGYITKEEIHTMMNTDMPDKTHELVRDLFLFSTCSRVWHIPMSRTLPPTTCKHSLTETFGLSPEERN